MTTTPTSRPIAIVTGASAGIGAAVAKRLAKRGMDVVACARREDRLLALRDEVASANRNAAEGESLGGIIVPHVTNLRDPASIESLFAAVDAHAQATSGTLTVLVNNAGLGHATSLMNGDAEKWREMLEVNVLALCICTKEAVTRMQRAKAADGPSSISREGRGGSAGHILHISSMSAHRVPEGSGVYSATKFAVRSLTEGLRKELRDAGSPIRISALSPGFVETEFAAQFHQSEAKAKETYGRFAVLQSEDVANMVAWVLDQPPHVEVHDVLVRPTEQAS